MSLFGDLPVDGRGADPHDEGEDRVLHAGPRAHVRGHGDLGEMPRRPQQERLGEVAGGAPELAPLLAARQQEALPLPPEERQGLVEARRPACISLPLSLSIYICIMYIYIYVYRRV